MKIGVLGSGIVAQTLGAGFIKHGDSVMLGTRDASKLADWTKSTGGRVGTFDETATFGEVVVLAVKGSVAEGLVKGLGRGLAGKVVMDTTNPIAENAPPEKGVIKFFTGLDGSLLERLQAARPDAKFVKAFNSVGSARMVNPGYKEGRPTMFICGNDAAARQAVSTVCDQFGWETLDLGGAESARAIEPLCILWCIPGFQKNEWTHAFKVLH